MSSLHNILFANQYLAGIGQGSSIDRVIGTGESFPTFPGMVYYNDLLLNNASEFDYFHINSVDGVDDAEVRDNRGIHPSDDGEDFFGSVYGGRSIVITGQIRCFHLWKTDDMREALKRAFVHTNRNYPLRFVLGGNAVDDKIIYCRKVAKMEIPMVQPTKDMPWVNYMIPLRAEDPRILSFLEQSVSRHNAGTMEAMNEGNYYARPRLRFFGPATTMMLTNVYENISRSVEVGPIADGDFLEVYGTRVRDSEGNHAYNRYNDDSDRITVGPGPISNEYTLTGTGLTSESGVSVQWRHSWI